MPLDTAQSLVRTADRTAENTAKSMGDTVHNPNVQIIPTLDPNSFIKQSQNIQQQSFDAAGIPSSFARTSASGQEAQDALDFVAAKYKQEELEKVPLEEMQKERDRLMAAKFRILPDMLARTDIIDYKQRINLANQLIGTYDSEISAIDAKRTALEKKATERAEMRVGEMQAKANILQQKATNDRFDLQSRIDLYQTGQENLQSILEKAVELKETNEKMAQEAARNPFIGSPGEPKIQGFTQSEVDLFQKYLAFGDWDIPDSVKTQYGTQLSLRYAQWVRAGKPVGVTGRPTGVQGPMLPGGIFDISSASDSDYVNPFTDAAEARKVLSPMDQLIKANMNRPVVNTPEEQ